MFFYSVNSLILFVVIIGSSSDEIDSIVVKTLEEIKQEKARKAQAAASSGKNKIIFMFSFKYLCMSAYFLYWDNCLVGYFSCEFAMRAKETDVKFKITSV